MPTCTKCNKIIKHENRLCVICNRFFHPGCADSYIKSKTARKCYFTSIIAAQKEQQENNTADSRTTAQLAHISLSVPPRTPLFTFSSSTPTIEPATTISTSDPSLSRDSPYSPHFCFSLPVSSATAITTASSSSTAATPSTGTLFFDSMSNLTNSARSQPPLNAQWSAELSQFSALSDTDKMSAIYANTLSTNQMLLSLSSRVDDHETRLNVIEQDMAVIKANVMRSSVQPNSAAEIIITGLPLAGHDLSDESLVIKIFEAISASRFINDIISLRRLDLVNKSAGNVAPPNLNNVANPIVPSNRDSFAVILRFKSVQDRNEVMRLKILKGDIFINTIFPDIALPAGRKIYLNEWLSSATYKLLKSVKAVAKVKKYERVWVRNEQIFIRKNSTSEPIMICSELDIKNIE